MKKLFLLFTSCILYSSVQAQIITTIAGGGTSGLGDGGAATAAQLAHPIGIVVDAGRNLYIGDRDNNLIRKVTVSGVISIIAGTGTPGYSGDGGAATAAQIFHPYGVKVDNSGNIYFADAGNFCVRKINVAGIITTIAGIAGSGGYNGDDIGATTAQLNGVGDIAIDNRGNIFIADGTNNRIRKVSSSGIITTCGGTGMNSNSGDGGLATAAGIYEPYSISLDAIGNLYIAEDHGHSIRKINTSGIITTVAGTGLPGYSGDNGPATAAQLDRPVGVIAGARDYIYIADSHNNRIRKIATDGIISTVAGTGTAGYSGDGFSPTTAELNTPAGVAVDSYSNLYIADFGNNRIRYIRNTVSVPTINASKPELHVYPNPSHGAFTVQWSSPESAAAQVIITSLLGEKVKELTIGANKDVEIQLNAVPGVYFINCMADGVRESVKVVISP
jgi:trimeric autotransporter adhesin